MSHHHNLDEHAREAVQHIERHLNKHPHEMSGVYREVNHLRQADPGHFRRNLHDVNAQLHKDGYLPHLSLVDHHGQIMAQPDGVTHSKGRRGHWRQSDAGEEGGDGTHGHRHSSRHRAHRHGHGGGGDGRRFHRHGGASARHGGGGRHRGGDVMPDPADVDVVPGNGVDPGRDSGRGVRFTTGMTIDTDGAGSSHGDRTHLRSTSYANGRLNADHTNFVALSPGWARAHGLHLGDVVAVKYHGKVAFAIYGDNYAGNRAHGEGSYRLARELGINPDPNRGGASGGVEYIAYPGSGRRLNGSINQGDIDRIGRQLYGGE